MLTANFVPFIPSVDKIASTLEAIFVLASIRFNESSLAALYTNFSRSETSLERFSIFADEFANASSSFCAFSKYAKTSFKGALILEAYFFFRL